jgi:hypothetical protein
MQLRYAAKELVLNERSPTRILRAKARHHGTRMDSFRNPHCPDLYSRLAHTSTENLNAYEANSIAYAVSIFW